MSKDPDETVKLTSAANEMYAGIIVAALEREGIQATMAGTSTADFRVGLPEDVEIYVKAADLARAQEVLEEAEDEDSEDFDDEFDDEEDEEFDDLDADEEEE